jgi:hypothetical protein
VSVRVQSEREPLHTLIVGGDYIDGLVDELTGLGLGRVEHWGGRKVRDLNRTIPADMDLVVVLFDYVSHNLLRKVRAEARRQGLPLIYSRRSAGELRRKIGGLRKSG